MENLVPIHNLGTKEVTNCYGIKLREHMIFPPYRDHLMGFRGKKEKERKEGNQWIY